jgi:hypothetical protein
MAFLKTKTLVSAIDPTVTFTFKTFSEGRRLAFRTEQGPHLQKLYELQGALVLLDVEADTWKIAVFREEQVLTEETKINPLWLKHFLKEVKVDGEPMTVEAFTEDASRELFKECLDAIKAQAELSPVEKNV